MATRKQAKSAARAKAKPKREVQNRPQLQIEKSAGAVVFHRGEQLEYLLILSTYWEFPKGQVEPDESETDAAVREVREETGIDVQLVPGFRKEINYFYRRGGALIKKQVVYFLAQAEQTAVQVSWEHHKAQWLPFEAAMARLKYENARAVLEEANQYLHTMTGIENIGGTPR